MTGRVRPPSVGGAALAAGPRAGLLMAIGIGFGLTLEGLRFGFAGPWRMMVVDRDAGRSRNSSPSR
ncbi:hypothetical protein OKA06_19850 [Novosphingobium sp. MW5]|nr:hypothetical protein [Novosphingobium sp. MW5]